MTPVCVPVFFYMKFFFPKYYLLLITILLSSNFLLAQKKEKVELIYANTAEYSKRFNQDVQRVKGNVIFKQEETYMYCDSAWFYETANKVEALGKVHIKASDTLNIFGDTAIYDGDKRIAVVSGNAKVIDNQMVLTTDKITYELDTKFAYYLDGGKIVDQNNTLISDKGYYYTQIKEFFFKDNVELDNQQYIMRSDTLMYHTITEIARFYGPTTIEGDSNFIYCSKGWYDTKKDISQFMGEPYMITNKAKISGDTLYYDRNTGYGKAVENVKILDTTQNILVVGELADYYEFTGFYMVTDSAILKQYSNNDTLFLHADTLKAQADSLKDLELLKAYYNVRFFKSDLQGVCDSLSYDFRDSLMRMYVEPVLWSEQTQLSADSIRLLFYDGVMDKLFMYSSSLILNKDDTASYNQIKGVNMVAYFKENDIHCIDVFDKSETIYFVREDNGALIGINKAQSKDLRMYISDARINRIIFLSEADAILYPDKELAQKDRFLKAYKSYFSIRPKDKNDIFKKMEIQRELLQEQDDEDETEEETEEEIIE